MKTTIKNVVSETKMALKLANMKKQIANGTVDKWISESTKGIVPHKIDNSISHVAYLGDDKVIYLRLNDEDLLSALKSRYSFKDSIQVVIAHEMGHVIDPHLEMRQKRIDTAITFNDKETACQLILEREKVAWHLGEQFCKNTSFYKEYNQLNMKTYLDLINSL